MKIFYKNRSNLLNDLLPRIEFTDNLLLAKAYLDWNSVLESPIKNYALSKEYGIPSICFNHGLMAENDHNSDIVDHITGQNGKPMMADYYWSWGQGGKQILLDGGVPKEKIKLTGCPIIWSHKYWYGFEDKVTKPLGFRVEFIVDPITKERWELVKEEHELVTYKKGEMVTYFPNHSNYYMERITQTFDQIKDIEKLFVLASSAMIGWKESPFKIYENDPNRHEKIMYPDYQSTQNIQLVQEVLRHTKVAVLNMPSTIQLQCWAAGVHCIIPKNDWGIESKSKGTQYNVTDADILCEPDQVKQAVEGVLSGKIDKTKEMKEMAEKWGGVSLGNPTDNMLKLLNECQN